MKTTLVNLKTGTPKKLKKDEWSLRQSLRFAIGTFKKVTRAIPGRNRSLPIVVVHAMEAGNMAQKQRGKDREHVAKSKRAPKRKAPSGHTLLANSGRYDLRGFGAKMDELIVALREARENKLIDEITEDRKAFEADPKQIDGLLEHLRSIVETRRGAMRMLATAVMIEIIKTLIR
jgi:hypothetical protein